MVNSISMDSESWVPCGSRQKGNAKWSTYGCVLAGEGQHARVPIDPKRGDLVAALIARIQKLTARGESEIAGIITPRQGFSHMTQPAVS